MTPARQLASTVAAAMAFGCSGSNDKRDVVPVDGGAGGDVVSVDWVQRIGGKGCDRATDVDVDDAGNIVVIGEFGGTLPLDGGDLVSTGGSQQDVFVIALGSAGDVKWSRSLGGPKDDWPGSVDVRGDGSTLVTGTYWDSIDVGAGVQPIDAYYGAFVVRLGAGGAIDWGKTLVGPGPAGDFAEGWDVAFGASDATLVTGEMEGSVDFAGHIVTDKGAYVAGLDADGAYAWSHVFPGAEAQGSDVAVSSDAVFAAGTCSGEIDLGDGKQTFPDEVIYLAQLSLAGERTWAKAFPATNVNAIPRLATTGSGELSMVASFGGSLDLDGKALDAQCPMGDLLLARFGASGGIAWSKTLGDATKQYEPQGVDLEPDGTLVVAGLAGDVTELSVGTTHQNVGALLLRVDDTGSVVTEQRFRSARPPDAGQFSSGGMSYAADVAVHPDGGWVLVGAFNGGMQMGDEVLSAQGCEDVFVVKLSPLE